MNKRKSMVIVTAVVLLMVALGFGAMMTQEVDASNGQTMCKPVLGSLNVTQEFGVYNPTYGYHEGIDIVPRYDYRVFAPSDGVVQATGYGSREGNYIVVQHRGGDSNPYRGYCPLETWTKYYHLESYYVYPGQKVTKGQLIGKVGSTGSWCTGRHLHFEIRENGRYGRAVNPREYIRFGDGKDLW